MPSEIYLSVFNSFGLKIDTLLDGYVDVGEHDIVWTHEELFKNESYINMQMGKMNKMQRIVLEEG